MADNQKSLERDFIFLKLINSSLKILEVKLDLPIGVGPTQESQHPKQTQHLQNEGWGDRREDWKLLRQKSECVDGGFIEGGVSHWRV